MLEGMQSQRAEGCAPLFLWNLLLFQKDEKEKPVNSPNAENHPSGRRMAPLR